MNLFNDLPLRSNSRALGYFAGTILAASALLFGQSARAADGTWIQLSSGDASGTWSNAATGNWAGGIVADGSGFTADFSTLDITVNSAIALGEPRTIGNLIFGDTATGTPALWTLNDGGDSLNVLTLAGTTPTITTNASGNTSRTIISTIIDGTDGLTKDGVAGSVLVLTGANTYSGGTTISSGILRAQNDSALGVVGGDVTVATGAELQLAAGVNIGNNVSINGGTGLSSSSGDNTLSGTLTVLSDSRIESPNAGGGVVLRIGDIDLGSNTLEANANGGSTGLLFINGAITGDAASGITKTGSSPLTITSDQTATYSGTTTLQSGTLSLGNNGALGTGTLAFALSNDQGVTIRSSDATDRTFANAVTIGGGNSGSRVIFGGSSTGDLTFTGDVTLTSSGQKGFRVANTTTFDGAISGNFASSGIRKETSAGTLVLNGANTYTGATTVSAGTLIVNGSLTSATTITAGTLGGSGSTTGAVVIGNNAGGSDSFIAPGNSPGTFTTTSSLTLNSDATYQFELDSGTLAADQIVANGVTLDSNSVFDFSDLGSSAIALSTVFVAIDNTSGSAITGTFLGLAEGATFTSGLNQFQASYVGGTGNDFTLTVVPEPSTFAMLLGSLGMLIGLQRARRRK